MGKYLNGYKPGAREGRGRPYVPPGWSEWDVAGNGYPEYGYNMNSDGRVRALRIPSADYLTDVLARKGLSFIDRSAAQRRPFMLELATFAPHAPYTPAPRDAGAFQACARRARRRSTWSAATSRRGCAPSRRSAPGRSRRSTRSSAGARRPSRRSTG